MGKIIAETFNDYFFIRGLDSIVHRLEREAIEKGLSQEEMIATFNEIYKGKISLSERKQNSIKLVDTRTKDTFTILKDLKQGYLLDERYEIVLDGKVYTIKWLLSENDNDKMTTLFNGNSIPKNIFFEALYSRSIPKVDPVFKNWSDVMAIISSDTMAWDTKRLIIDSTNQSYTDLIFGHNVTVKREKASKSNPLGITSVLVTADGIKYEFFQKKGTYFINDCQVSSSIFMDCFGQKCDPSNLKNPIIFNSLQVLGEFDSMSTDDINRKYRGILFAENIKDKTNEAMEKRAIYNLFTGDSYTMKRDENGISYEVTTKIGVYLIRLSYEDGLHYTFFNGQPVSERVFFEAFKEQKEPIPDSVKPIFNTWPDVLKASDKRHEVPVSRLKYSYQQAVEKATYLEIYTDQFFPHTVQIIRSCDAAHSQIVSTTATIGENIYRFLPTSNSIAKDQYLINGIEYPKEEFIKCYDEKKVPGKVRKQKNPKES